MNYNPNDIIRRLDVVTIILWSFTLIISKVCKELIQFKQQVIASMKCEE